MYQKYNELMSKPKIGWVLFFGIFLLAISLRLYKITTLTTFGEDQGQDFLTVRDMVLFHKWTLLGIKTSAYSFYQGPIYLYMLLPFFAILKLQPVAGAIAAVFYSATTLILLFVTVKKYFSTKAALLSSTLFAISPQLIIYGNTPLYQHFLPLFIIASIYFFLIPRKNFLTGVFLGITLGLGVETHLLNVSLLAAVPVCLLFEKNSRKALWGCFLGIIIGLFPTILFELRHGFLNTHLLFAYRPSGSINISFTNILNNWAEGAGIFFGANSKVLGAFILVFFIAGFFVKKTKSEAYLRLSRLAFALSLVILIFSIGFTAFGPYYILPLWLVFLIMMPVLIEKVCAKKVCWAIYIFLILVNLGASVSQMNINHGYTMPAGWSLVKTTKVAEAIAGDCPTHPNFNVASLLAGSPKAYAVRYSLLARGVNPEPINTYASNNYLYVVVDRGSQLEQTHSWEVLSFSPYVIGKTWDLGDGIYLYRLDRQSWLKYTPK